MTSLPATSKARLLTRHAPVISLSVCLLIACHGCLHTMKQSYHIIVSVNSLPKARRFRNLHDYLTQRMQYRDITTAMFLDYCHKLAVEGFMWWFKLYYYGAVKHSVFTTRHSRHRINFTCYLFNNVYTSLIIK